MRRAIAREMTQEIEKIVTSEKQSVHYTNYDDKKQRAFGSSLLAVLKEHGSVSGKVAEGLANSAIGGIGNWDGSWDNYATGVTKAYRSGESVRFGKLQYKEYVLNSKLSQVIGKFAMMPEGAAAFAYLNDASFGLVERWDENGALAQTQHANPEAYAIGENAGTAVAVFQGAAAIIAWKTGGKQLLKETIKDIGANAFDDVADVAHAAKRAGAGGTFDLGVSSSRYSLSAPRIAGFEGSVGTIGGQYPFDARG